MFSKGTELLHSYIDSHFVIVYLISQIEAPPKQEDPASISQDFSINQPSELEQLKLRLDEALAQNEELRHNYDQMDKLVHDRDRESRGFRKQIEHFEQESRRARLQIKELQMKLNDMEGSKLNVEKEKEQLIIDLKAVQKRLENEKVRSDTAQANLNSKELELMRTREVTNQCNKQIKFLNDKLAATKAKKKNLKECL